MAQVAFIQRTHAGGPCLSPVHKDPQFPGQFSGGSPYPYCLCGSPEDQPRQLDPAPVTQRGLQLHTWTQIHRYRFIRHIHRTPESGFTLFRNWRLSCHNDWKPPSWIHVHAYTCKQLWDISNRLSVHWSSAFNCVKGELHTVTQAAAVKLLFSFRANRKFSLPANGPRAQWAELSDCLSSYATSFC